ncbi:MAG: hypothetical protein P4N60_10700 [Verrucomicrobiae bacterium]|nr:hypothetical protein [Verrucomicrobiae bacterium]
MESELKKILDEVHNEESFLKFVQCLIANRLDEIKEETKKSSPPIGTGANGWENTTVESYLEAASAWAADSNFGRSLPGGLFRDNSWHQFATFLYAGKIYE